MTEKEKAEVREKLIVACASYEMSLHSIRAAINYMTAAINKLKEDDIKGLGQFEHYRDHMIEMHRVLAQEYDRRWASITGSIKFPMHKSSSKEVSGRQGGDLTMYGD